MHGLENILNGGKNMAPINREKYGLLFSKKKKKRNFYKRTTRIDLRLTWTR